MDINNKNLGCLFQRKYYDGLTLKQYGDDDEKRKAQKDYFEKQNRILIDASKVCVEEENQLAKGIDNHLNFCLQTTYPGLITGVGMVHATGMQGEIKFGFSFDYTSGLPVISGSSVKGLLRSMFPFPPNKRPKTQEEKMAISKQLTEKRVFIKEKLKKIKPVNLSNNEIDSLLIEDIDDFAKDIFEDGKLKKQALLPSGHRDKNLYDVYDRDVFFDAQIKGDYRKKGFLSIDYITPHKDELENPTPIQFLKILPNVKFIFHFRLNDCILRSGKIIRKEDKLNLFKEILTTIGIGAKTNVGYGQLKECMEK